MALYLRGNYKTLESSGFEFVKKYPLWFDAIYISYLSEKYCGKRLSLIKGLFIGLLSNIKALLIMNILPWYMCLK